MKSMHAGCLSTFAEKEVIFYANLLWEPPVKGMLHFLTSAAVSQIGVHGVCTHWTLWTEVKLHIKCQALSV